MLPACASTSGNPVCRVCLQELDFEHEAANMERSGANLSGPTSRVAGLVVVPQA